MNSESQVLALHQTRQGAERLRELVATSPVAGRTDVELARSLESGVRITRAA